MTNENYIVINGKRAELTEEQLKQLGIVTEKESPFRRVKCHEQYWAICKDGFVTSIKECDDQLDKNVYSVANYCTDRVLMQQRAWHETLSRLLWRYSMEHEGDKIDWNDKNSKKYFIDHNCRANHFDIDGRWDYNYIGVVYFYTKETAQNAIEEVVKPFMKEHPDFVW